MNQVLIISGPTASGKTSLAIKIAKKFNGELISADSRQIYKGMDIGTGKDHPHSIPIHLVDIITPNQTFSSTQFCHLATAKIKQIHQRNKLPIIVGGTGYYINSFLYRPPTAVIPPRPLLRKILTPLPISFIQFIHQIINRRQFQSLSNSEKYNRHRLIRKLEIKLSASPRTLAFPNYDCLHISLFAPIAVLYNRIDDRVKLRLNQGLLSEIKTLLKKYNWSSPGLNTLAYKEFRPYFQNPTSQNLKHSIKKWSYHEHAYARRQLTWFKKSPDTHHFSITASMFPQPLLCLISKWYNHL